MPIQEAIAFASAFDADPGLPDQRRAFRVLTGLLALALALRAHRAWQVNRFPIVVTA